MYLILLFSQIRIKKSDLLRMAATDKESTSYFSTLCVLVHLSVVTLYSFLLRKAEQNVNSIKS